MKNVSWFVSVLLVALLVDAGAQAQSGNSTAQAVPNLVGFSGTANDIAGKPLNGVVGITFALYSDQEGGAPLWLETQNVTPDHYGHYSVLLGSTRNTGVPAELFSSGEARWVGVQVEGQPEQARVLLLSVPYAMKAADAATIGGLPPSAFVLAAPASGGAAASVSAAGNAAASSAVANVSGSGAADFIPLWTSSSNLGNSILFQSGSGSSAKLGVGTSTPGSTLDVKGAANIQGLLTSPATGTATATSGRSSQAHDFVASAFSSSTGMAVSQTFEWRAEPSGNNTANATGTLNLLFGSGASAPSQTGLKLSSKGVFTFAAGQTFPGAGTITGVTTAAGSGLTGGGSSGSLSLGLIKTCANSQVLQWNGSNWVCSSAGAGTITGVTAGSGLTGGGTSGTVALGLDITKVPLLASTNVFNAGQTITGNLSLSGSGNGVVFPDGSKQTTAATGGGGSVTSVGLSAPSSDFTVSGSPVTNGGTLGLNWTVAPTSSNIANAIVKRDSSGNFAGNGVSANLLVAAGQVAGQTLVATNTTSGDFTYGIIGQEYGTGRTIGVEGMASSPTSVGVAGNNVLLSGEGVSFFGPAGVWGDSSITLGNGLLGSADEGTGVLGLNNSRCFAGSCESTAFLENDESDPSDFGLVLTTLGAYGNGGLGGFCDIDTDGNFSCNGFASAVVPVQGGARNVAVYAVHSPQNWFEDFGSGQLTDGAAVIQLEPAFGQTVNTSVEYHVFLTPNGDSRGLYVTHKTPTSFEVREQAGGTSNVAFDYRIVALRKGSEALRLQDKTEQIRKLTARAAARRQASNRNVAPAAH